MPDEENGHGHDHYDKLMREIELLKYKVQQIQNNCTRDHVLEYINLQKGAGIAVKFIMAIVSALTGIAGVVVGKYF